LTCGGRTESCARGINVSTVFNLRGQVIKSVVTRVNWRSSRAGRGCYIISQEAAETRKGKDYGYQKLLMATGGKPRRLTIPGGDFVLS